MIDVYNLYKIIGYPTPRVVCEVGVNSPDKCSVVGFIRDGVDAILVEPLPWLAKELKIHFPKSQVIEGVVGDRSGPTKLYDRGEGSWIEDVPSGCAPDEHPKHSGTKRESIDKQFIRDVWSYRFDELDNGDIDVLCVDVEGAEWIVIKRMKSLPWMIRVETHFTHSGYWHPNYSEIAARMSSLGYLRIAEDVSDTLFVRPK